MTKESNKVAQPAGNTPAVKDKAQVVGMVFFQASWEHLCDAFKVRKQVAPASSYAHIGKAMGLSGLKEGLVPNFLRTGAKNIYRTPIAMGAKKLYDEVLPEEIKKNDPTLTKGLGTATMVLVEPVFSTPTENWKTVQMTKTMPFAKSVKETWQRGAERGLAVTAVRQYGYWAFTLGANRVVEKMLQKKELSPSERAISSVMSGTLYTAVSMPLDVAKTKLQQHNSPYTSARQVLSEMKENICKQGIKVAARPMAAGFLARATLASGSSFAATYLLDKGMADKSGDAKGKRTV